MRLQPYPEYKPSGSPWLGRVPVHWHVRKLRTLVTPRSERNQPELPLLSVARERGVFVRSLTGDDDNHNVIPEDLSNYKVARKGDLVINKMKAWQGSMGIAPCDGIVSPAYFVFDFQMAHQPFGQMLIRSKPYVAHFSQASDGVRVGQWDLSIRGMREIPILVPSDTEQRDIARFLEMINRRIERVVLAKKKLITLLNEQKQAVIYRGVTRGLDPDVRLKPSGADWVVNVPEHWQLKKVKFIKKAIPNSFVDGPFGSNLKSEHYVVGGDVYVIESGFITSGEFVWKEFKTITREHFETIKRSECRAGDIIIAKIGAYYGMAGILPRLDKTSVVSGNSLKLTVSDTSYSNRYVHLALLSARAAGALEVIVNATAQPALSLGAMNDLALPVPSKIEQEHIIENMDRETRVLDSAIDKTTREIKYLREYRTRLISDVVTGKIDVRGIQLPEIAEVDEYETLAANEIEPDGLDVTEELAYADD